MSEVALTLSELRQAGSVGVERMLRAMYHRRHEPHGRPSERGEWDVVIRGVASEVATAKALNVYWGDDPQLDYNGDVGPYHVRSTDLADGCLLLYPKDPDDAFFILVVDALPVFRLAGFIRAGDGKCDEYRHRGRLRTFAWMVPQKDLAPIEELPR